MSPITNISVNEASLTIPTASCSCSVWTKRSGRAVGKAWLTFVPFSCISGCKELGHTDGRAADLVSRP